MTNYEHYRRKRDKEMHEFVGRLVRMGMDVDTPGDMRKAAHMAKDAGLYAPSTYVNDIHMEKHFNQYHALREIADLAAFRPDPSAMLLAECRDWIAYMPHKPPCACLRIINELGEAELPCNCGRDRLLSRLAEAGVPPK